MAVKKNEKTGTWYFYGSYKMKNGKYTTIQETWLSKKERCSKSRDHIQRERERPIQDISHLRNYLMLFQHIQKRE